MKKLLIVLAMVAMASLLMGAGCFTDPEVPNQPPEIISSAVISSKVGEAYTYGVEATDPEGDILAYSLTEKPLGMSIVTTTGMISWNPTDAGVFGVVVMVSDGELSDSQEFSITVAKADEPEPVEICPVVSITSEVEIEGKKYIGKGEQTVTVTFAVPTEPVSVYVGYNLKKNGYLPGYEVVMYPNDDKTIYTGDFVFGEELTGELNGGVTFLNPDCSEAYIYVETCETCAYCKYPYTVDKVGPFANIEITEKECICEGESSIKFDSAWNGNNGGCGPTVGGCCDDDCSGLASWTIDIYDLDPLLDPLFACCAELLYSGEGEACPVLWETDCTDEWLTISPIIVKLFYAVIELKDATGNTTKYYAKLIFDKVVTGMYVEEWVLGNWISAPGGIIGIEICP